jgi:hypothetical protein
MPRATRMKKGEPMQFRPTGKQENRMRQSDLAFSATRQPLADVSETRLHMSAQNNCPDVRPWATALIGKASAKPQQRVNRKTSCPEDPGGSK